ncbi:MAG: hypothetical protein U5Q16_12880 [Gammaproteobacteria bacterium]|nr:hypothetical protein [Gammaproteobacteria bacterium]
MPGLGYLFKQKSQTGIKSELVILLKPIVVESQEHGDFIKASMDRMKDLKRALNSRG